MTSRELTTSIIAGILSLSLTISGLVLQKKDKKCEITSGYHTHLYEKSINDSFTIKKYLDSEKEKSHGFHKTNEYILATTEDLNVYDLLSNYIDARDNIDYINYQIANNRDYLEYYYYYTETKIVTHTYTDEDGNTEVTYETKTETHSGWSSNPRHEGVTGEVRVCHYVYRMSKLLKDNNQMCIRHSEYVDDPRELLDEYPYMTTDNTGIVTTEFKFNKHELPYLNIEDFDPYYTPSVESTLTLKK